MITKKLLTGGINVDDAEVLMDKSEYLGALNVRFATSENGKVGRITNIEGNQSHASTINPAGDNIPFVLPAGVNTVVGSKEDDSANRLFYFVSNSNGNHGIYCYDGNTGLIYTVLTNSQVVGGLSFGGNLHSVDIIGSILSWTEGLTDPRLINADAAIKANHPTYSYSYGYSLPMTYESSTVIKRPPIYALQIARGTNTDLPLS
jgi:hypothetical protein